MTGGAAAVVIVGGGIIGAAIAYECARHGTGRVVVVDKAAGPGEGSTGASSSICRTRYSDPEVVEVAVDGVEAYRNWAAYLEVEHPYARFEETGVLWIADRERTDIEREVSRLLAAGASALALGAADLERRHPGVDRCVAPVDLAAEHECRPGEVFLFEDHGGHVDPTQALRDLLDRSAALGAEIRFGAAVCDVVRSAGRVVGVQLADGSQLGADVVINAAGPWCNQINAMAGVDHRWTFTPTRIQTIHHPWPQDSAPIPIVIDMASGVYARPDSRTGTVWVGSVREEDERETVEDPDSYLRTPHVSFRDDVLTRIQHRLPGLLPRGTVPGIAGLYTINRQDVHPVVGPSGVDGFWLANGFSGHGFKLAPAIGSMLAQALGGSTLPFDTRAPASLFDIDRTPIGVDAKNVLA